MVANDTTSTIPTAPAGKSGATSSVAPAAAKTKKARALSGADYNAYAARLKAAVAAGKFPDKTISVSEMTQELNVSESVFNRIFIHSGLQAQDYRPVYDDKDVGGDGTCYIDNRLMLTVGKSYFEACIKDFPDDQKFKSGQKFRPSLEGKKVVLTPVE